MKRNRQIALAKLNEVSTEAQADFINEGIRKDYSQSKVEAIICNALDYILEQLSNDNKVDLNNEHVVEYLEYSNYRKNIKKNIKKEF